MYSGDTYSCSVGNPFICDSETNHVINSHTHSGQLEKQSVCSVPEGPSEIASLAWKTLFDSLSEIIIFYIFCLCMCMYSMMMLHTWTVFSVHILLSHFFFSFGRPCQVLLIINRHFLGEPVQGPTYHFQRVLACHWSGESKPLLLFPLYVCSWLCLGSIHLYQYT